MTKYESDQHAKQALKELFQFYRPEKRGAEQIDIIRFVHDMADFLQKRYGAGNYSYMGDYDNIIAYLTECFVN